MEPNEVDHQPDIQDRIRELALTNQLPQVTSSGKSSQAIHTWSGRTSIASSHPSVTSSLEPDTRVSANFGAQNGFQPPRPGKRRPNQAQRRQMSSELSLSLGSQWQALDQTPRLADFSSARIVSHFGFGNQSPYSSNAARGIQPGGPPPRGSSRITESIRPSAPRLSRPSPFAGPSTGQSQNSGRPGHESFSPHGSQYTQTQLHRNRRQYFRHEDVTAQVALLDTLCYQAVRSSEIERDEIAQKEAFRQKVERICRETISDFERNTADGENFPSTSVELKCFGSLSSGFATKSSDMDLGLFSPFSSMQPDAPGSIVPRLLEKAFLDAGLGARLLSRTRVPIIKLCESPSEDLRNALLVERSKWDCGSERGNLKDQDEDELKTQRSEHIDAIAAGDVEPDSSPPAEFELPTRGSKDEVQRLQLRQNAQSPLPAYYALAKRVLRRAGGRDISLSNHRDFTKLDWVILNGVCQAFIRGLRSTELRDRLESFPSLSSRVAWTEVGYRSLAGVYAQVQGEQTILTWNNWLSKTNIGDSEEQIKEALDTWRHVQQRTDFGVDPLGYNRDLQNALEKIKRLPSIQLCQLEQDMNESPSQYYLRAKAIVCSLGRIETNLSMETSKEIAIRYITGINNDNLRQDMKAALDKSQHQMDLDELGQQHKCLHLAYELEMTVGSGLYSEDAIGCIKGYIELLRTKLTKLTDDQPVTRFVIPVTQATLPLMSTVQLLQPPHKLGLSRPRDRYQDTLEFPSGGVGVQCDINFSAHLALQNTSLLRCYSLTDCRVRPIVLFIKRWAKVRGINSGYRGTLGSYGYVLMVLHYLVNVASPFVCPNLQHLAPSSTGYSSPPSSPSTLRCQGYDVEFWNNENEIMHLARNHQLTRNTESIGQLLRGFFEYFAQSGPLSRGFGKGFDWGRDVLSLRTHGGLLTKQEKGWTGAKTIYEAPAPATDDSIYRYEEDSSKRKTTPSGSVELKRTPPSTCTGKREAVKEIRHRYLFAIEDPFELDHNVARTVTHNGIVSIRDEFRRAWRIIRAAGSRDFNEDLLVDVSEPTNDHDSFMQLLEDIHGPRGQWGQAPFGSTG